MFAAKVTTAGPCSGTSVPFRQFCKDLSLAVVTRELGSTGSDGAASFRKGMPLVAVFALAAVWFARRRELRRRRSCDQHATMEGGMPAPRNYYSLLGLPETGVTHEDVHRAYRRVMKLVHPDVLGGRTEELASLVGAAYQTLSDDNARAKYDKQLNRNGARGIGKGLKKVASWAAQYDAPEQRECRRSVWSPDAPEGADGLFVDETKCVICHNCVSCAPNTFAVDSEGSERAHVVCQYGDSEDDIDYAMLSCPTEAIYRVPAEDVQGLEDAMLGVNFEEPHVVVHRRLNGNQGMRTAAESPWQNYRTSNRFGLKSDSLADRKASEAIAASIAKAMKAVPEQVLEQAWPRAFNRDSV